MIKTNEHVLGISLAKWMEGQTTEDEDRRIRMINPDELFQILIISGHIGKEGSLQ